MSRVSLSNSSSLARQLSAAAPRATGLRQRQLDLAAKRGQRRAQLVRQGGTELAHLPDRMFEPPERVVEGTRT